MIGGPSGIATPTCSTTNKQAAILATRRSIEMRIKIRTVVAEGEGEPGDRDGAEAAGEVEDIQLSLKISHMETERLIRHPGIVGRVVDSHIRVKCPSMKTQN